MWFAEPCKILMSLKIPALTDFRRIVVKVGSSLLVDSDGGRIHEDWLKSLVATVSFSLMTGTARHSSSLPIVERALR